MLSLAASGQVRSSCGGAGSRAAAAVPSAGDGLCRRTPWPGISTGRGRCCLQRWARTCSPLFAALIPSHRPFLMGRRGHQPLRGAASLRGLVLLETFKIWGGQQRSHSQPQAEQRSGGRTGPRCPRSRTRPQPDPGSVAQHRPGSAEARCPSQACKASCSPPSRSPPCKGDPRFSQLPTCSRRNPQALLLLYYLQAGTPPTQSTPISWAARSPPPGLAWEGDSPGTRGARARAEDPVLGGWGVTSRRHRTRERFQKIHT